MPTICTHLTEAGAGGGSLGEAIVLSVFSCSGAEGGTGDGEAGGSWVFPDERNVCARCRR